MDEKEKKERDRERALDEEFGKGPDQWGFSSERFARRELRSREARNKKREA